MGQGVLSNQPKTMQVSASLVAGGCVGIWREHLSLSQISNDINIGWTPHTKKPQKMCFS